MTDAAPSPRVVAGAMTGTSLDGIDAAVVVVSGQGLAMRVEVVSHAADLLGVAKETLQQLISGECVSTRKIAAAADALSNQTAAVMRKALGDRSIDFAGVHGQTVLHAPPYSWQLINAVAIAEALACPVASNMRGGDLAAGGEGAPITPLADWILFRSDVRRAIVNLGGYCNITWLPPTGIGIDGIRGRDICVCNQLLDAAAMRRLGSAWDKDGQHAAAGVVDQAVSDALKKRLMGTASGSLGTGDESLDWLDERPARDTPSDTLLASMAHAIGSVIGAAAAKDADEVLVAGGGCHHRPLVDAIAGAATIPVVPSSDLGIPIEAREAACIAILAALDRDGISITLPSVTGRHQGPTVGPQWCEATAAPEAAVGRDLECDQA